MYLKAIKNLQIKTLLGGCGVLLCFSGGVWGYCCGLWLPVLAFSNLVRERYRVHCHCCPCRHCRRCCAGSSSSFPLPLFILPWFYLSAFCYCFPCCCGCGCVSFLFFLPSLLLSVVGYRLLVVGAFGCGCFWSLVCLLLWLQAVRAAGAVPLGVVCLFAWFFVCCSFVLPYVWFLFVFLW